MGDAAHLNGAQLHRQPQQSRQKSLNRFGASAV
jgi:hypothetical protein